MSKEAMKLALEALVLNNKEWKALADSGDSGCWSAEDQDHYKQANEAIKALEEALAKQEQGELGAKFKSPNQRWEDGDDHDPRSEALYKFIADTDFKHCNDSFYFKSGGDGDNGETLMFILDCWFASTPQQRTWVGLDEEDDIDWEEGGSLRDLVEAVEAKLKEKNT